jgi:hypothetical protein
MPKGMGTYGSKLGRPPKKKKESARESAIRRGGQKTEVGKFMGKMMTGKASPHTNRNESPLGRMRAKIKKIKGMPRKGSGKRKK